MESYLPKVAMMFLALAAISGAAPKRPFSHKLHLGQVATCQGCHSTAETSTRAEDNLLPDPTACATCHDEVTIKEPRRTPVARFNHSIHVKANPGPLIQSAIQNKKWLGPESSKPQTINTSNTCLACHHDIDQSENITDASALAYYPRMSDCLVCHNKIDPPQSCKQCHAETMQFRPTDHTPTFVDVHAEKGKIDKANCASCHGREFTCKGCH